MYEYNEYDLLFRSRAIVARIDRSLRYEKIQRPERDDAWVRKAVWYVFDLTNNARNF